MRMTSPFGGPEYVDAAYRFRMWHGPFMSSDQGQPLLLDPGSDFLYFSVVPLSPTVKGSSRGVEDEGGWIISPHPLLTHLFPCCITQEIDASWSGNLCLLSLQCIMHTVSHPLTPKAELSDWIVWIRVKVRYTGTSSASIVMILTPRAFQQCSLPYPRLAFLFLLQNDKWSYHDRG